MNVHYTGKLERLSPALQRKLDARFAKLGKLLDRNSEKEAHVILTAERHLKRAEITVNYYDHPLVAVEAAGDAFSALTKAVDKLQRQLLKQREKWRDTKRGAGKGLKAEAARAVAAPPPEPISPRVFRVNSKANRKPISLDEALLEMEQDRDYLVYRDSDTDRISVLLRRRDGHFDLIES